MIFKIYIAIQAERQYDEIINWYETQSQPATDNFIKELDKTFKKIASNPSHYRKTHGRFRILKMKIYPYYIIFSIKEKEKIIVIAKLYHTSRNPKNKFRNLGKK